MPIMGNLGLLLPHRRHHWAQTLAAPRLSMPTRTSRVTTRVYFRSRAALKETTIGRVVECRQLIARTCYIARQRRTMAQILYRRGRRAYHLSAHSSLWMGCRCKGRIRTQITNSSKTSDRQLEVGKTCSFLQYRCLVQMCV